MPDELNIFAFLYLEPDQGTPIKGEAQDCYHTDEIQVLTYSFGVSNPDAGKAGAGKEKSKSEVDKVVLSTVFSKASPQLFLSSARGDKFKCATISVRKLGPQDKWDADYHQVQLCDVYITRYSLKAGDSVRPTEELTLGFQTIDISYRQQDEKGNLGPNAFTAAWSANLHKKIDSQLTVPYPSS